MPSFLLAMMVKIVWDITVMAGMEDKLYFRMDQSGKLRMKRNIVFVSGLDMDVKSLSAEQREGVERLLKSQAMGFIRDKEDEAMYAMLVDQLSGEQIISVESGEQA